MSRRGVAVGLLLTGVLVPVVPLLVWAGSGQWRYPALVPQRGSARGLRLLTDSGSELAAALATSLAIAASVTLFASVLGLGAGRALGRYAFRGKRLVQFALLAPAIVPSLAVTLGVHVLFLRYGLADTVRGVVLVHLVLAIPYVSFVLAGAFATFDAAYEQQARVLGAGPVRTFVTVTLPALRPALAVAAYFAFLVSWGEYVLTLVVGGGGVRTLPLLLFGYVRSADLTLAAFTSLALVLPPLVLAAVTSRYVTGHGAGVVGWGRA